MQVRRAGVATASATLFALAGLHAAWGAGSAWPLPDREALAGLSALSLLPAGRASSGS